MNNENYYQILGVEETATQDQIKKSYRKLAKDNHPDVGGDEEKFKKIAEAYDTLGDENKRAVTEDGGIEGGEKIIVQRHDAAEILFDQLRMFPHGLADRTEDHAVFGKLFFEGRGDGHAVKNSIDRNVGQPFLFT